MQIGVKLMKPSRPKTGWIGDQFTTGELLPPEIVIATTIRKQVKKLDLKRKEMKQKRNGRRLRDDIMNGSVANSLNSNEVTSRQ